MRSTHTEATMTRPDTDAGMVENRGAGLWLTHAFMIVGVLIVFFPIWLAFVASTVTQPEIVSPPMPLWPGDHLIENYKRACLLYTSPSPRDS